MSEMKQLNVDFLKKERYVINGDENLVLEIDTSDFNITKRLEETYPKINQLVEKYQDRKIPNVDESDGETALKELNKLLDDMNEELGNLLDYLFDANVYEIFGSKVNLFSMKQGQFTFELIIDTLLNLYSNTISEESKKMQKRLSKHTSKYIQ